MNSNITKNYTGYSRKKGIEKSLKGKIMKKQKLKKRKEKEKCDAEKRNKKDTEQTG